MAEMNLNTLVLRGVTVVGDVLGGQKGIGCYSATAQMPALRSLWRHASSSYSHAEPTPRSRPVHVADAGVDDPAARAGRPGSCCRVLARRSPALGAGRIIGQRCSAATGGPRPTAVGRWGRFTTRRALPVGEGNSRRRFLASAMAMARPLSLMRCQLARKRQETGLALKWAGGTLSASTRGTGDR